MSEQANPTPEPTTPETPDELAQLRTRAAERDQYLNLAQRTQAEFENYQKRARRDAEEERKYALWPLARDLLQPLDNLERALASTKEETPLSKGVGMVLGQLVEALKRNEIRRIEAVGKPFDPNQHEAVMQQPSADHPPGTVLQVLEQGYQYRERILRPAKVILAKEADA
jgi:molecular chaperone GrpE